MAARKKSINFEKSLTDLEEIVESLESGDLPLEQALKTFEKGVKLTRECQQALADAEQKVSILLETDNGIEEQPFVDGSDDQE